jgi:HEAT repeat protein
MNERWQEVAVAGHTGDVDTARAALADADPQVRQLGLGALERLRSLTDDEVSGALIDIDASVRRRAAILAAQRPGLSLLGALGDTDPTVVEAAAWACGEQERADDAVLDRLIELATSAADPLVREASAAALGAIGDGRGLPAVLRACTDKPAIRRRAVLALAAFDGVEVEQALQAALSDRDWQVRQAAEDVLRAGAG